MGDEAQLLPQANLGAVADQTVAAATEASTHLPGTSEPLIPVNRFKWSPKSAGPCPLVPPVVAQRERGELMRALCDPSDTVLCPAFPQCSFGLVGPTDQRRIQTMNGKVELEIGVMAAKVETWRCH